jgi:hypothetical protein
MEFEMDHIPDSKGTTGLFQLNLNKVPSPDHSVNSSINRKESADSSMVKGHEEDESSAVVEEKQEEDETEEQRDDDEEDSEM